MHAVPKNEHITVEDEPMVEDDFVGEYIGGPSGSYEGSVDRVAGEGDEMEWETEDPETAITVTQQIEDRVSRERQEARVEAAEDQQIMRRLTNPRQIAKDLAGPRWPQGG